MAEATYVRAASLADLAPGTLLGVELDGVKVCLAHADGKVYAFQDNCTHKDFPMHSGEIDGTNVTCAWHGAKFDMASGRATRLPAIKPLKTYPVKVDGDDILVAV